MSGGVLLGSDDKVALGELRNAEALGLELMLRGFQRPLSGKGVGGKGHACAEVGLMYVVKSNDDFPPRLFVVVRPASRRDHASAGRLPLSHPNNATNNTCRFYLLLLASATRHWREGFEGGRYPQNRRSVAGQRCSANFVGI